MTDERDPAADTKHFTAYEAVAAIEELTEETGGCADMDEYTAIVQRAIDASHAPSPGLQEAARQAAVECAQFATVWFDKPIVPGFGVTGTRQLAAILTRKFAPLVERLEQLEEDNAEYIKTIGALRAQRDRLDKMYADERDDLKAKLEQAEAALALYKVPKSTSLSGQGADGLKAKLATAEKEIAHLRDRTRCHEYVCSRCGNVWAEESGRQTAAKCHRCGWIVRCPRCQPPELRALKAKLLAAEKDAKRLREAIEDAPLPGICPVDVVRYGLWWDKAQQALAGQARPKAGGEVTRLWEALEKYGCHYEECEFGIGKPCDCGFEQALAGQAEKQAD